MERADESVAVCPRVTVCAEALCLALFLVPCVLCGSAPYSDTFVDDLSFSIVVFTSDCVCWCVGVCVGVLAAAVNDAGVHARRMVPVHSKGHPVPHARHLRHDVDGHHGPHRVRRVPLSSSHSAVFLNAQPSARLSPCHCSFQDLFFRWTLVWNKFQIWRLVTPFFCFGKFGFMFLFSLSLLYSYGSKVESNPYPSGGGRGRGNVADFIFMFMFGAVVLLFLGHFLGIVVLGPSMLHMIM